MKTFTLRILGADEPFYEGACESLILPLSDGKYGVQAHHADTIAAIVPGTLRFSVPGEDAPRLVCVSEGLLKIEQNTVLVLVSTTERPEEIDQVRAEQAAAEAREALLQKKSAQEYRLAQERMARAIGRIKTKKRSSKG